MTRQARPGYLGEMAWLGAIAFCNALGSVIVFPLAPFVASDLSVPVQDVALTSLCFNGAAGLGGLASALFFGRLGSRHALLATLTGLAVSTGMSAIAPNFAILLVTRLLGRFVRRASACGYLLAGGRTRTQRGAQSCIECDRRIVWTGVDVRLAGRVGSRVAVGKLACAFRRHDHHVPCAGVSRRAERSARGGRNRAGRRRAAKGPEYS